jgi:transcription-repair coupling factor
MIFSGIPHTTASLFHMRDFVKKNEKTLLYVDSESATKEIQNLGISIFGERIETLTHASELFTIDTLASRIILLPSSILALEGNIEWIKRSHLVTIKRGDIIEQNDLIEKLLNIWYEQSDYRWEIGTYKREWAVIRIMTKEWEWTMEYFDNEIESIIVETNNKHSHEDILELPRINWSWVKEGSSINMLLLDLIKDYPLVLLSSEFSHERDWIHAHGKNVIEYSSVERDGSIRLDIIKPEVNIMEDLKTVLRETFDHVHIFTKYEKKLREFFEFNQIPSHHIEMTRHAFGSFIERGNKSSIVLWDDIFSKIFIENRVRKSSIKHLDLLLALKEWDLVVHREHGIGKYITLEKKRIGLIEREYMQILYGNGDKVFLPLTELGRITKYVGEPTVELSRLEGKEWEKALSKTDEEVALIAEEILSTEAKRRLTKRIPFQKFETEENAFLKAFPHLHTPDQHAIIEEIRKDMESEFPMDRLISWDVGFGKTEVAMNAIYKAVLSGMQVAVISPLLILAEEHKETFEERLSAFGVKIASLTRLTSKKEETEILKKMKTWEIDVVVGTHRLLSEDIHFRRLWLLIIDEEHRFWVGHKEAIKKMKAHIDILSLSATPIPRSLNLALSGLKKISLLTTPPPRKKPIETIVIRWDEGIIRTAIELELKRWWQVIILHNRIRALPMIEEEIREILGVKKNGWWIRITITHGQMPADDIEERIHDFKHGKYDILLSTTVIENGVNFLGANTIIVSDAEEFWLAQLHQIRGRVGRKDVSGKCYLMYRKYELSQIERERLIVLSENSGLGSGYEIAMRDMQIRGTWDILGFRQSGKSKEVGISLYFQLLEEKIETLKFGKSKKENTKIELDLSYVLPEDFFDSDIDKLSFFREIEAIESLEDLNRMEETFLSPEGSQWPLSNLFLMMRTSLILSQYEVSKLTKVGQNYHFDFYEGTTPHILRAFLERFDKDREMVIISVTKIRVETKNWGNINQFLRYITGEVG